MKYFIILSLITSIFCNEECTVVKSPGREIQECDHYCHYVVKDSHENLTCENLDQMHATPSICSDKCTIRFLGYNGILRTNSFALVNNLEQVFLNNTMIKTIQSRVFSGAQSIKLINLSSNQIGQIPKNTFSHLSELTFLDLSYNQIREVEEDSFVGCNSLKYIDFSTNHLRNFSSKTLESILQLETLNLSRNSLEIMDSNWCLHFHSLKNLIIDHNKIKSLVNCTSNVNMDILSISNNLLNVLDSSKFPTNLKILDVSANQIAEIKNKPFENLSKLRILNLSKNKLNNLPFELFVNLKNLTHLDVSSNNLMTVNQGVFHGLISLKFLNLSSIDASNIEGRVFYSAQNLIDIDLTKNNLIDIDIESLFGFCENLQYLRLDGNSFTCTDLSKILLQAEKRNVSTSYGVSYGKTNMNGIECFEDQYDPKSNQSYVMDFFERDFKKSSFFKYFSAFKQPPQNNFQEFLEIEKELLKNISGTMEKWVEKVIEDLTSEREDRRKIEETSRLLQRMMKIIESEEGSSKNNNLTSELFTMLNQENRAALTAENSDMQSVTSALNSLNLMFFVCILLFIAFCVVRFFKVHRPNFDFAVNGTESQELPFIESRNSQNV